jgi:hypothetical protein
MKRQGRIGGPARLLCPRCRQVSNAFQNDDSDNVFMDCGHTRSPDLLPSPDGAVGLEDIESNTPESRRLFPILLDVTVPGEESRRIE